MADKSIKSPALNPGLGTAPATPNAWFLRHKSTPPISPFTKAQSPPVSPFTRASPIPLLAGTPLRLLNTVSVGGILDTSVPEEIEEQGPQSGHTWFPRANIIKVDLSEPRDVLQSERTFLGFVRFALSLYFTAVGLILGFSLKSEKSGKDNGRKDESHQMSTFNKVVSFLLVFLAFSTLVMAGFNYFRTVRRYSQRKIQTHAANNAVVVACVSAVVITLAGLNVSLIVERYIQDR